MVGFQCGRFSVKTFLQFRIIINWRCENMHAVNCTVKIPDNKGDIVPQAARHELIEGIFKIEKAALTNLWEEIPNNFLLDFFR